MKLYLVFRDIDMQYADVECAMVTWAGDYPNQPIHDHVLLATVRQYLIRTDQMPNVTCS
jgi:hypothetical protein